MIRKIIALCLLCLILAGCSSNPAPGTTTVSSVTTSPTTPTTPVPPQPTTVMAGYFTALNVNFYNLFVTSVTVAYDEDSLTQVYTVDDTTYQATYDYHGRLLHQRTDSGDYWEEYTYTYTDLSDEPLTLVYAREGFSSTVSRTFDDEGKLLTTHYQATDDSWNTYTYTYDDQGRQLTEKYVSSGGSDTLLTYTYDESGNRISEVTLNKGVKTREVKRTYDEKNQLIQDYVWRQELGKDIIYTSTTDFTYDENGNILTQHQQDRDGFWQKIVSTYDEKGNILTERHEDSEGYTLSYVRTYDENSRVLTSQETCGDFAYSYTYTYDEHGNLILERCDEDGYFWQVAYTYDQRSNLLERLETSSDGEWLKEVYTYDSHGNLLSYAGYDEPDTPSSFCTYTYAYVELTPEQAQLLSQLMASAFCEFTPA